MVVPLILADQFFNDGKITDPIPDKMFGDRSQNEFRDINQGGFLDPRMSQLVDQLAMERNGGYGGSNVQYRPYPTAPQTAFGSSGAAASIGNQAQAMGNQAMGRGTPLQGSGGAVVRTGQGHFRPGFGNTGITGGVAGSGVGGGGVNNRVAGGDVRDNQTRLAALIQAQAEGRGPSIADLQMRLASDRLMAQQQALALSNRRNPAMGQRMAALQGGQMGAQIAGQAALARLQEQQGAQALAGNMYSGMRNADLNQMQINDRQNLGLLSAQLDALRGTQQGMQQYQDARTKRYGALLGVPTDRERLWGMVEDAGNAGLKLGG